jgi:hypothetical protein
LEHEFYFSHHIGNFIIPTDELHHFSEGWRKTTNKIMIYDGEYDLNNGFIKFHWWHILRDTLQCHQTWRAAGNSIELNGGWLPASRL